MKNEIYSVREKETGTVFEIFESLEDALLFVLNSEKQDILKGEYSDNYYEIYDNTKGKVIK